MGGGGNLEGDRQKWGHQCFDKGMVKSGFFGRGAEGVGKKKTYGGASRQV